MIKPENIIKEYPNLGFSTGYFHQSMGVRKALSMLRKLGFKSVELGESYISSMRDGEKLTATDMAGFDYVSMHAPKHTYVNDELTNTIISAIEDVHAIRPLNLIVVHPDLVRDFGRLNDSHLPFALENSDKNKPNYQEAGEFVNIFDKFPNLDLVIDVNHIYTNDPSMKLAEPFYELFRDKIKEIQLSAYTEMHDSFLGANQPEIIKTIQDTSIPIIHEGLVLEENIESEVEYIATIIRDH